MDEKPGFLAYVIALGLVTAYYVAKTRWFILAAFGMYWLSAPTCRSEPLSNSDMYRQVAVSAALIADASQTLYAYEHRDRFGEKNVIIRAHYSPTGIRNYFGAVLIGSAVVTRALPPEYRPYWQYGILAVEIANVARNKRIGVRFEF